MKITLTVTRADPGAAPRYTPFEVCCLIVLWIVLGTVGALLAVTVARAAPPAAAEPYRAELTREARHFWGISAPVAMFAGQIAQESAWRPTARSRFASGLTQFTPDTARWIAGAYPRHLAGGDTLNPSWAIRALVIYDLHLWTRLKGTASACERAAMTLAGYNGGAGWVNRDRRLARDRGANPAYWFGHTEHHSARAAWAFRENRDYPRKILLRWQPVYAAWGPGIACP